MTKYRIKFGTRKKCSKSSNHYTLLSFLATKYSIVDSRIRYYFLLVGRAFSLICENSSIIYPPKWPNGGAMYAKDLEFKPPTRLNAKCESKIAIFGYLL